MSTQDRIYRDSVVETSNSTGQSGPIALSGAAQGFFRFFDTYQQGEKTVIGRAQGANREILEVTYDRANDRLDVTKLLAGTNGAARVDWQPGSVQDIFVSPPGELFNLLQSNNTILYTLGNAASPPGNDYTLTTPYGFHNLENGMRFSAVALTANPGSPVTLNVDGIGAATVFGRDGVTPLAAGAIIAGVNDFIHDGMNLRLLSSAGSLIGFQVITATGSYTPIAGAKIIFVEICGGGGGGGGGASAVSQAGAGGGGGAGQFARKRILVGALTVPVTVTIGAGGNGGAAGANSGTAGTSSSFGPHVTAAGGGLGGGGGSSPAVQPSVNGGAGGNGGGGADQAVPGEPGQVGVGYGSAIQGVGGAGGAGPHGGSGRSLINQTGSAGAANSGAGGSGGGANQGNNRGGGAGGSGFCVIWEFG